MMNDNNNFYVQITNNDSVDIFPNNSPSYFKSKLSKVINLQDKWVIALVSIYLPPNIINFSKPMNVIEVIKIDKSNKPDDIISSKTLILPEKRFTMMDDLLSLLNTYLDESKITFYHSNGKVTVVAKM